MSGLLRRLTRRRPATADETGTSTPASSEPAGAPAETPAEPGGGHPLPLGWSARGDDAAAGSDKAGAAKSAEEVTASSEPDAMRAAGIPGPRPAASDSTPGAGDSPRGDEQATQVLPATGQPTVVESGPAAPIVEPPPARDLPAGIDPSELAGAPAPSARRGRLRRRLRYLRAVRDLLLRDLGGFVYEIHRTGGGTSTDIHRRLIEAKTNRITALDTEVRGIEGRLGEPHADALLREPGIGGTCPECGELHASDAHYCARCGAPLDARARARRDAAVAAAVQQTTGSHPTAEPAGASVLWAAGPRPERAPQAESDEEPHPSPVTSQWLALSHHGGPKDDDVADASPTAGGDEAAAPDTSAQGSEEATAPEPVPSAEPHAPAAPDSAVGEESELATHDISAAGENESAKEESAERPTGDQESPAASGDEAVTASADEAVAAKPKRPRASRARKPAADAAEAGAETTQTPAGDAAETVPGDEAAEDTPAKPERARAKKPAEETPGFEPGPNGKRGEDVPPPLGPGDPLTSQRDQGS